ncbi:MAG: hypothetical protein IJP62_01025 [Treponema sp.]|nr:hypothetical protein [Treponema sp.]
MNKEKEVSMQWYDVKELHNHFGLAITFALLKIFPAVFVRILAFPVGFCYFLFSKKANAASRLYLRQLNSFLSAKGKRVKESALKHIVSFAITLTEKLEVWSGKFSFKQIHFQNDDVHDLIENLENKRGAMVIVSHLGNSEMLRGLAHSAQTGVSYQFAVNTILDTKVTAGFNAMVNKINSGAMVNIFSADSVGPDTILILQEKIQNGELVVIAGDRMSANTKNRFIMQDFLGKPAPFAYGAYLLTALLDVPTYFMFGVRKKDLSIFPQYDMFVKKNPISFDCPRKEREERIMQTIANYAHELERLCAAHPYQWYNFFDFWA